MREKVRYITLSESGAHWTNVQELHVRDFFSYAPWSGVPKPTRGLVSYRTAPYKGGEPGIDLMISFHVLWYPLPDRPSPYRSREARSDGKAISTAGDQEGRVGESPLHLLPIAMGYTMPGSSRQGTASPTREFTLISLLMLIRCTVWWSVHVYVFS
jgi:hypothetical protein